MRIFPFLFLLLSLDVRAQVLVNEVKVNPPGADEKYEFIEIRSNPNSTLNNIYVCVFDGDSANPGVLDRVFRVMNTTLGNSGLMLFATTLGYQNIPGDCIFEDTLAFGIAGGIIENGTNTYATFFSPIPFVEGSDYDVDNDGELELPVGAVMMDAVGWTNGNPMAIVYGGAILTQSVGTPDAAVRFFSNVTPFSSSAWYCGDLTGLPSSLEFDPLEISSNFPSAGAVLTPGAHNQPGFSSLSEEARTVNLILYPNPTEAFSRIVIPDEIRGGMALVQLFGTDGRLFFSRELFFRDKPFFDLDLSDYPSGIFHLRLSDEKFSGIANLIKTDPK
jgi:hypothetical protein